jgi:hypothetical protein
MNKNYYVLTLILTLGLYFTACKTNSNNPVTSAPVGSISVKSDPTGAQIWLDGTNTGKITPDSLINIKVGNHTINLIYPNYIDTSSAVLIPVTDGNNSEVNRILLIDISITLYGPVQIFESANPVVNNLSGIILSTGIATVIDLSSKSTVDLFYSSSGYVISSAQSLNNNTGRSTFFFESLYDSLFDGISSPTKIDSWVTQIFDTEVSYFFIYDADSHYSKMIITDRGGTHGSVVDPAWIKVKWLYNNKPGDLRF